MHVPVDIRSTHTWLFLSSVKASENVDVDENGDHIAMHFYLCLFVCGV